MYVCMYVCALAVVKRCPGYGLPGLCLNGVLMGKTPPKLVNRTSVPLFAKLHVHVYTRTPMSPGKLWKPARITR